MDLKNLSESWDYLAKRDPLWAILTHENKKNGQWNTDEFFATGKKEIQEILSYLSSLKISFHPGKALDFGCGVGRLTLALSEHFEECWGVDISAEMISLAKKYNTRERCQYILNSSPDLSIFPSENFHFIYTNITLQHIENKYAWNYLGEFFRLLQPGGVALFQIPSEKKMSLSKKIRSFFKKWIPSWIQEQHKKRRRRKGKLSAFIEMHCLTREKVISFVEEKGCTVVDVKEDTSCGDGYRSYLYCARKNGSP